MNEDIVNRDRPASGADAPPSDLVSAAVVRLVRAAPGALEGLDSPLVTVQGLEKWVVDSSNPAVFRRTTSTDVMFRGEGRAAVTATPEWGAAVESIAADAGLGPLIGQLVGTVSFGATIVDSVGWLEMTLARALVAADPDDAAATAVRRWREVVTADPINVTTLAIVTGAATPHPQVLAAGLSVRSMTDDEVSGALALQAMPTFGLSGPITFVNERTCIALVQREPRSVGPIGDFDAAMAYVADSDARIDAALATLRIAGFAAVREVARLRSDGRGATTWSIRSHGSAAQPPGTLDDECAASARLLLPLVEAGLAGGSNLAVAIRRFSGAHEPRHREDRYLDLWIAIEALVDTQGQGETTYQTCLNLANAVEVEGTTRRQLFNWLKDAYGLRSTLVHGRATGERARRLDGTTGTLDEVADDLRDVVRAALVRRLEGPFPNFIDVALGVVARDP